MVDLTARGELEYGNRLCNERELMGMPGVSRPTLRKALRVLEFLDIVAVAPRRGILINQPRTARAIRRCFRPCSLSGPPSGSSLS